MKEVPLDESDIESCQEFVNQAIEEDKIYLLLRLIERKKTKTIGMLVCLFPMLGLVMTLGK